MTLLSRIFSCFAVLLPLQAIGAGEFDGWIRKSEYVAMPDGVRLAVEYYRPTISGRVHETPLPVVWRFTPYLRFTLDDRGETLPEDALRRGGAANNGPQTLEYLLRNGYVVADVDMRGFGASFGVNDGWMGPKDAADARVITDWFAVQPWSSGEIGMTGMSYLGGVQYLAMTQASPHLKAIFPGMSQFDHYGAFYLNGVYRQDMGPLWRRIRLALDYPAESVSLSVAPVSGDSDRSILRKAVEDHYWNRDAGEQMRVLRFRDSVDGLTGRKLNIERSFWSGLEAANDSGVAVYHWTGWYDHGGLHQLLAFANLEVPQKIHIGPYYHRDEFGVSILEEQLRWFDYWLKGIDNGIMDEPPIRYFVAGDDPADGWKTAETWPLAGEVRQHWYFSAGESGTVASVNDGRLLADSTSVVKGRDLYTVDAELALADYGYVDRNNGVFRPQCAGKLEAPDDCYTGSGFPDLSATYDAKSLTYTTDILPRDITAIGHPVVRFWASSDDEDAKFFVVLEEVEPAGRSNFVSYYAIKGAHRKLGEAPYYTLGLPWPTNYEADESPMTEQPVEIALALNPVANRFDKGNRIRVTIAGADRLGGTFPVKNAEATLTVYRGGQYESRLELPVIDTP